MLKIKAVKLNGVLDGSGLPALALALVSSASQEVAATLTLPKELVMSANERALIKERLEAWLVKQEVDELLWQTVQKFVKDEKNKKYLPKPIGLLVEMAVLKLLASAKQVEVFEQLNESLAIRQQLFLLPTPLVSLFNGGSYGDTNLDFKDYLLIPLTKNKSSFAQKLTDAAVVYQKLATVLRSAGYDADVGSLGAYAPDLVSTVEALDLIIASINLAGFSPAKDFGLGVDIGAQSLYDPKEHNYLFRLSHNYFNSGNLSALYREWLVKYPIFYMQDPLAVDDTVAWQDLTEDLREELVLAGGEVLAADKQALRRGLAARIANTVVLDLQACESLADLVEMALMAKKHNYQIVLAVGERETNETMVADLAVALGVDFVKFGALARGERTAKYSRLLEIAAYLENSL
jgi:enolase